ncbi:nucleotidyltransferase family protein [Desulfovibrio sp. OttesenSCG-928-C06]|nr:nucleotidyltransferase family protein [Desulfovibrio sp. OttesenSCG-928-C06]
MEDWRKYTYTPDTTLSKMLMRMDATNAARFAMVLDQRDQLLGVITDGDIRRTLVKSVALDTPLHEVMHRNPVTVVASEPRMSVLSMMHNNNILHVPVIDENKTVVGAWSAYELQKYFSDVYDNPVIIMAGGMGTRLGEITKNTPKPLLPVGGVPILERILHSFVSQGFSNFYITINYLAEHISSYFGDGSKFGAEIKYLTEEKRMGTVGVLSRLAGVVDRPCIVMNGDILTRTFWPSILAFHESVSADVTMVTSRHEVAIPFGVIQSDQVGRVSSIKEKPTYQLQVSAGINVLSAGALDYIPEDTFFDMPNLIRVLLDDEKDVFTYELQSSWIDIGTVEDYQRANLDGNV